MLTVLGISHKTAPLEIRERVAFSGDDLEHGLASLKKLGKDADYLILSTCNRTEIYTTLDDMSVLIHWLGDYHQISVKTLSGHLYTHHGHDAISHLMHVACGLDSMVLGEPQILGQLKEAYARAKTMGSIHQVLDSAFTSTFNCAKTVRSQTAIGRCPVSVALSAIRLGETYCDFSRANIGLIGAGNTAELLIKHLQDVSKDLIVFNRTLEKAQCLAARYGKQSAALSELPDYLAELDLILIATNSPDYLITPELFKTRQKKLLLIDLSVPRGVSPDVANLNQIQLLSIDDIQVHVEKNILARTQASLEASELISAHITLFEQTQKSKIAAPYIANYRAYSEQVRDSELTKAVCLLDRGVDPKVVLSSLAHHLTNKLIHRPTKNMHLAGTEGEKDVLEFAQKIFKPIP